MKTLKTKKINLFVVYLNTNIKPSDYSSAEEMKVLVNEIRPAIKEEAKEFIDVQEKISEIQRKFALDGLTEKDATAEIRELNKQSQKLEFTTGEEIADLELENEPFNQLMNFYNRTGKTWFVNAERYMEFDADINKANQQPKDKEK